MSILIVCPNRDMSDWVAALHSIAPSIKVEVWPEVKDPGKVEFAVSWDQPPKVLGQFPNLKCISSIGAGVEHLLNDATRPVNVPLVRLVDENLKQSMAEFVVLGALEHYRRFKDYRRQQDQANWEELPIPLISGMSVGIMGFGEMGAHAGGKLHDVGFRVSGWNRSRKQPGPIRVYTGDNELGRFLEGSDILVCLLPLTHETENILNIQTFRQLPQGAYLINAGRGGHLVEEDLLKALDSGRLSGALLDVFRKEPLPDNHPFWTHEKITVTPHIASVTDPGSASVQVLENYRRALEGEPLLHLVDIERGY